MKPSPNPHRLTAMLLAALHLALVHSAPSAQAATAPIAAALQPFVEKEELAGAVALVATKDKVLAVEAVGFADRATQRPMKTDAIFWIASQSKPITGAAVMILVDEGNLNLDDAVEKYLPEFKGQMLAETNETRVTLRAPAHPITVREILSHTSGLPFKSKVEEPTLDGLSLRDAVASYAKTPLTFEPGTKYTYSNAGINTAARLIEVLTGQSYEAFMDARLFKPLGMKDTTFWPSAEQLKRLATPHKPNAAKTGLETNSISQLRYPLDDRAKRFPMPAGGLFSTATDVAKFCQMVLNGGELNGRRYLSAKAVKEMTSRQTPASLKENYGLGWSAGPTFGHGGALATNMTIDPARGLVFVWLVQHSGYPGEGNKAQGVFKKTAEDLFAKKP